MTFRGLRLMVSAIALTVHSLAAPAAKLVATTVKSAEDQTAAQQVRDTLAKLTTALVMTGAITSNSRKTEVLHHNGQNHHPQNHQTISTLIHLLLTISSAFAPLIGAIVGPLLTNIANGITWAISHTIASGFSPPHGLFSPEFGHGINQVHKERPSSYAVDGQSETPSDTIEVRQPAAGASSETIAVAQQTAEPQTAAVDDTRNEMKKNMR